MFLTKQEQSFRDNRYPDNHDDNHGNDNDPHQRSLQTILEQVALQSCEDERFCQTVQALESQYDRRMYAVRQLLQQLDRTLALLDEQHLVFQEEHNQIKEYLKQLESELPMTQRLAIERQDKRKNRQRQYDRYYWIPLLASRCKTKYMRASDKHVLAEHRIAQIREALDACQDASGRVRYALGGLQQEYNQVASRRGDMAQELVTLQHTLTGLLDRRQFWCDFEAKQVRMVIESAKYLARPVAHATMESWLKTFQMACFEYGERLSTGKERWGPVAVEFDCVACNSLRCEWPTLTTQGLVCEQCRSRSEVPQGQRQKLLEYKNKVFPRDATANRLSLKHGLVGTVLCKLAKSRVINESLSKSYFCEGEVRNST